MVELELKLIIVDSEIVAVARSPFGETLTRLGASSTDNLFDCARVVSRAASRGRHLPPNRLIEMGDQIFDLVFKDRILDLYNRTAGACIGEDLVVRLVLGDTRLNRIPWELARHQHEFLCFRRSFVRHPFLPVPPAGRSSDAERLRFLSVGVDPVFGPKTYEHEMDRIRTLINGFHEQVELVELRQEQATSANIRDRLLTGFDVFHFMGHSRLDNEIPDRSGLVVWSSSAERNVGILSMAELSVISFSNPAGFVFLNGCDTASGAIDADYDLAEAAPEVFPSMAYSLIRTGVPVIVATMFPVTVEGAQALSNVFYTNLIQNRFSIDRALRMARAATCALARSSEGGHVVESDWMAPVLYARSRALQLFDEKMRWEDMTLRGIRRARAGQIASVLERPKD